MSDSTTFALAPISVPFPPRQAPSEIAHQSGVTSSWPCIAEMIGSIVAQNGMLSKSAEITAEPINSTSINVNVLPPVTSTRACASIAITPVCFKAPTITNNPPKNVSVVHSTSKRAFSTLHRDNKSMSPAADIAIMLDFRPS